MAGKRNYGDRCGIARGLDLIGERWALLVVRELIFGPKRFTDLRAGLPNLSPDVLTNRLRDLVEAGIVQRRTLAPPAASKVYELTAWGRELQPVLLALGRWGSQAPSPNEDAHFGPDSMMLALKTMFNPIAAEGFTGHLEVGFGDQVFDVQVEDGELDVVRGAADTPDVTIQTSTATLAEVLWHGRSLETSERDGSFTISGDRKTAEAFLDIFRSPVPA